MPVTPLGIVIEVSERQSKNALFPIDVTPLGMVIVVKLMQLSKTLLFITVTLLGMVREVRPVQPLNAEMPMLGNADARHTIGDGERSQTGAAIERRNADARHTIGDGERSQTGAMIESRTADGCYTTWPINISYLCQKIETCSTCVVTYIN